MYSNNSNGNGASWARGFMALFADAGDGARLDGLAGGGGALRLCHE